MAGYLMHGLTVESEEPLTGYRLSGGPADVSLRRAGCRPVPSDGPKGQIIQSKIVPGLGPAYSTVRREDGGYLLRVHRLVDFEISEDLCSVEAWLDKSCPDGMLPILGSGLLVSVLLALRCELVLHASAVEAGGKAVAFSAESSMGKSTIAAIACSLGARLVTDDVLRLDFNARTPRCYLGSVENRLRRDASELSELYADVPTTTSVDGRVLLRPTPSEAELCPLVAVVTPLVDREEKTVHVLPLEGAAAVMELTRCLRVQGWVDTAVSQAAFLAISRLAGSTPLYRARLPWGPPFDSGPVALLLQQVGLGDC